MKRAGKLHPLALLSLSLCCGTALASTATHGEEFLSVVQGMPVPVLPELEHTSSKSGAATPSHASLQSDNEQLRRRVEQSHVQLQMASPQRAAVNAPPPDDAALSTLREENTALHLQLAKARAAMQQKTKRGASPYVLTQMDETKNARAALDNQLRKLRNQLYDVTAARAQLQKALTQMTVDKTAQQKAQAVLETQLAQLQAQRAQQTTSSQSDKALLNAAQGAERALTEKLYATQTSLTQLSAKNLQLGDKVKTLQASVQGGRAQAEQMNALQARMSDVTKTNDELKVQITTLRTDKEQDDKTKTEKITTLHKQLHTMSKGKENLQEQVVTLTHTLEAERKAADDTRTTLAASTKAAVAEQAQSDKALAGRVITLQAQLSAANKANDDLKAQWLLDAASHQTGATGSTSAASPAVTQSTVDIKDPQAQQTYASGVVMADMIRRTLALQADLGEKPDPRALLAGVSDGVQGTVRLGKAALDSQYNAAIKRLSDKEKAKYDTGLKRLEAVTAQKTLLKRNGSVFFVQAVKGGRALKTGDALRLSVRESRIDGQVLNDNKDRPITYGARLPYLLQQALELGRLGGSVDVYCFASDVYPPEQIPVGLYAYTLMKYTVSARG